MSYKCKNCGRSYEENGLKDLANTFTGKNWISQKGYCSDRCKVQYENNHSSSSSNAGTSTTKTVYVKPEKTADQIKAEAEVERMERDENASQPWKFDSNFYSSSSISKISFPDTAEDVEKTILKITKSATDKVKEILNQTYAEYSQSVQGDQKAALNPYYEEINFVETCIEKANDGIKKLRRFEVPTINAMLADCSDSIDDLKNNWLPKLIEKRNKKKKTTKMIIIGAILVFALLMLILYIKS